ncbi:MAG TPA: o-succinylbenzoate synthase [Acidimicrobiales bacterium]|nr:o-succinylbenzoate synthase [Acidimicrobiales bacterium]
MKTGAIALDAQLPRGRLVGFELARALVPLRKRWVSEAGTFSQRDSLLVRAVVSFENENGGRAEVEGWGECTALPEPTYSAEYTAAAALVSERYLAPALLRARVGRATEVAPALGGVRGHNMAKAAFEAAMLDAELRNAGLRLADFLSAASRFGSRTGQPPKDAVVAGAAVGLTNSLGELLDEVGQRTEAGYLRVKLKIAPGWDDEPLGAVRQRWPELVLFADANGSYARLSMAEAAKELARLDRHGLTCLEQPLGDDDLAGHAELARQVRTPVCLDEALTSVATLVAALDLGACSVVNIKAGRLGGLLEAVRAHDLCAERGVPVWCGGMVETGVGRAANLALSTLPNFSLPGDLSASSRFFETDLTDELDLSPDGTIAVPRGPGSGVTVNSAALTRFSTWRQWCPTE